MKSEILKLNKQFPLLLAKQKKERGAISILVDLLVIGLDNKYDGDDNGDDYELKNTWNSISIVCPDLTSGRKKQSSMPAATSTVI